MCTQDLFLAQFLGNGFEDYRSDYNLHSILALLHTPSLAWRIFPFPFAPWDAKHPSQASYAGAAQESS